jgi:putative endonuclease
LREILKTMADHNDLGKLGEDLAAKHMLSEGYKILDRNWIYQKKELDIVATDGKSLVVVEVKSRSTDYFEHPADAITLSKIKFLCRATQGYVDMKDIEMEVRFDVISVIKRNGKFEIEHIEDAFIAPVD